MLSHSQLTEIHRTFVTLYSNQYDACRIAGYTGIDVAQLNSGGSANSIWYDLLGHANRHDLALDLISVALLEYPHSEPLRFYADLCHQTSAREPAVDIHAVAHRDEIDDANTTYRLDETFVKPTVGCLRRVSTDYALPIELPIYRLDEYGDGSRSIRIGRHCQRNTIVLDDKSISREHALLVQRDGQIYLRDNASTSGTYLNWRQLVGEDEVAVRNGDLLSFGTVVYEFLHYMETPKAGASLN